MREVSAEPRVRLTFLAVYGLLGLAVAAAVHLGTYVGRGLDPDHPLFWLLHVGLFPPFFVFVFRLRAWTSARRGAFGLKQQALRWRELLPYFPAWVIALVSLLFFYTMANFLLSIGHLPTKGSGVPLTGAQSVYMVRAFSGHWLLFYALPALFFTFVPQDARPISASADGER
jgi:hypothetical protein